MVLYPCHQLTEGQSAVVGWHPTMSENGESSAAQRAAGGAENDGVLDDTAGEPDRAQSGGRTGSHREFDDQLDDRLVEAATYHCADGAGERIGGGRPDHRAVIDQQLSGAVRNSEPVTDGRPAVPGIVGGRPAGRPLTPRSQRDRTAEQLANRGSRAE